MDDAFQHYQVQRIELRKKIAPYVITICVTELQDEYPAKEIQLCICVLISYLAITVLLSETAQSCVSLPITI